MIDIKRIIREEIEKYILSEAIDFTNLDKLAQMLNNLLGMISDASDDKSCNEELSKFFKSFVMYCVQIIHAINRCAQAQSLNEGNVVTDVLGSFNSWGGLRDYGFNIPGELGGNLWRDTKQGYNNLRNALIGHGRGSSSGAYGNNGSNQVPSVKLSELLKQLPQWQQYYMQYNTKFSISNNYPQIDMQFQKILGNNGIIHNIQQEYQTQIQNAQGNP